MVKPEPLTVLGLDLAGSPRRPTGVCILRGVQVEAAVVYTDEDILRVVDQSRPELVPIDAPLSLPAGRKTIHDRAGGHFRPCDRALRGLGIRFFPITIGPMRMLTERGMGLRDRIEEMGCRAVECFPGAAQDVWGIPRKQHDLEGLRTGLIGLGVEGITGEMSDHELDAVTAALTGQWFLAGRGEILGGKSGIVMPVVE
jgi:predicted nuclease with RNAse H fold